MEQRDEEQAARLEGMGWPGRQDESVPIDARGRRLAWVPADEQVAFVVAVPLSQEETPYVRFGDWVVWLSLGVAATAAAMPLVRRVRARFQSNERCPGTADR